MRESLRGLAVLWFIGFTLLFFQQGLPNSPMHLTRQDVWRETPGLLLDGIAPATSSEPPAGWRYLPQRFDLIATAAALLCGSWHLGSLLLRAIVGRAPWLDRPGWFANAGLLGLSAWSLITLGLGLAGQLQFHLLAGLLAGFTFVEQLVRWRTSAREQNPNAAPFWRRRFFTGSLLTPTCLLILTPFVAAMLLGSMLPPTDFDVKAYHLVGPKEWFQQGRITFLPNNVYTNFPFLTEMLCLSTMALRGDWFRGALSGQLVLACFAPLAATMIFSALRRRFGDRAAWFAVIAYLTTPWVYRISIIAYVEGGLAAYLAASFAAFLEITSPTETSDEQTLPRRLSNCPLLCGLFAGSAAACKYPGILSAVLPLGVALVIFGWRSKQGWLRLAVSYAAGVLIAFGPWLLKNLALTRNPVYPLLWGVFGGVGIDPTLAAKFKAGHPLPVDVLTHPARWFPDLWAHLRDVAMLSDWQSALMLGLAPASLLVALMQPASEDAATAARRKTLWAAWLYVAWLFAAWWMLTHRIDRFWVPLLSVLAMLAGMGADQLLAAPNRFERWACGGVAVLVGSACLVFNLAMITSSLSGFNGYLMDEETAIKNATTQSMSLVNTFLPPESRTLLVGDAEVFDARRNVVAHSVFNRSLFEDWFAHANDAGELTLRPPAEIREELKARGITHVFVNWLEILRYRTTYGYSDFVSPQRFHELTESGVLSELPLPITQVAADISQIPADQQAITESWGRPFLHTSAKTGWFPAYQLFRVNP